MSAPEEKPPADPTETNRRVRNRQIALLCALVACALALSFVLTNVGGLSGPDRAAGEGDETVDIVTAGGALRDSDLWRGQAEAELLALRNENDELKAALDDLATRLERTILDAPAWDEQMAQALAADLEARRGPDHWDDYYPPAPVPPPVETVPVPVPPTVAERPSREIEVVSAASAEVAIPAPEKTDGDEPEPAPAETRQHYGMHLPAGTFFRATLLGSLDAPTGQSGSSNPLPVLLKIGRSARLPNAFLRDVRECLVTGAGYGDISSERAYIRTERLSCVTLAGEVVDVPIKGYVAGEDGKTGLRGALVSRQGQVLARSLLAGVMSGVGEAFHDNYSDIRALDTIGGSDTAVRAYPDGAGLRAGISRGAASSLDKLADYYLSLADRMHPIVEISAGRKVDVILQEGVDVPDLRAPAAAMRDAARADMLSARYGSYADRR